MVSYFYIGTSLSNRVQVSTAQLETSLELIQYREAKAKHLQSLQDPKYIETIPYLHKPNKPFQTINGFKTIKNQLRNKIRRNRKLLLRVVKVPLSWSTPGNGMKGESCGSPVYRGCLNMSQHPEGKAYVIKDEKTCYNPRCPKCFPKWIARETMRSTNRIMAAAVKLGKLPNHIMLMPDPSTWDDFKQLDTFIKQRDELYRVSKIYGFTGGEAIYHSFRDSGKWGPHFHLVAFGNIGNIKKIHGKTGWVIKYRGTRETRKQVYGTIRYELDHCGIPQTHKGRSIVSPITWFGSAAYNKLGVKKTEFEAENCPYCTAALTPITWRGKGTHPGISLEDRDLLDPGGWEYASRQKGLR